MKTKFYSVFLLLCLAITSCKNEEKKEVAPAEKQTVDFQLSNYSDENWNAGVGKVFNMFLLDNNPTNLEAVKKATVLEFADGTSVKILNYTIADTFIQINIAEKASDLQSKAGYPNYIFLK